MRSKAIIVSLAVVTLVALTFGFFACAKKDKAPTDADIIKAIEVAVQKSPVSRLSPIVIEEKGNRNTDGSWTVKAKFHGSVFVDYKYRKELDKEATYVVTLLQDPHTGETSWQAVEKQ